MNWLMTGCLWLHVAAASCWVLGGVIIALAAAVVRAENGGSGEPFLRVLPKFNRANATAAAMLLATGLINIFGAEQRHHFALPPAFTVVLGVKVGLYLLMMAALMALFGVERKLRGPKAGPAVADRMGGLVALSAFIGLAGAVAMLLGVWLAGA